MAYCIFQVIYSVTVVTGDTQYAGTDTNVFLTVFGANGSTEEMLLPKNADRSVPRWSPFNKEIEIIV